MGVPVIHAAREAITLPPDEIGTALLAPREDQWFDRKSARISPTDLVEHICGMANAEGGVLVLGLSKGKVEGIAAHGDENGWRQANLDFLDPPAQVRTERLECVTSSGKPDHLFLIEVEPSDRMHTTHRDEVFLRVGDETRRLRFEQRQELAYDKGDSKYEATLASQLGISDVDPDLVQRLVPAGTEIETEQLLQARGFTRDGRLTVGGSLLFTRHPQIEFPEAHLRVIRYRGLERGSGARQNLVSDTRLEGPLTDQIRQAMEAVTEIMPTRRALGDDGRFTTVGAVPRDAWLEGIVNAVTHRSYSLAGDHTRIEVFDDRVEIRSPGRFPGIVDLTTPESVSRYARNPRIARVLADLEYGQEQGEGIRRMFEEMRLARLADPVYEEGDRYVKLTLSATPIDEALEQRLPRLTRSIVRHLREHSRASTGDLATALEVSRPTLRGQLKVLQDEGIVAWHGTAARDPRAYWYLPSE